MPSLTALRAFDAAARLGSFKDAAEVLNVSATAVSHHIRGLEAQIGVALFVRGTRQVSLTAAGRELSEATASAFLRIETTLDALSLSEKTLTISATPAFAALWLAPRIGSFEAQYPDVNVKTISSTERVDFRRDKTVDVAIRYGSDGVSELDSPLALTERFMAYGSAEYIERLQDLSEAQFISTAWVEKNLKRASWVDWFAVGEMQPPKKAAFREFLHEHEVLQAGLAGQGLILLSDVLAGYVVSRRWLQPYRPEIHFEGLAYCSLCSAERKDSIKVRDFISWLVAEAKN